MANPYICVKIFYKNGRTVRKIASRKSKRIFAYVQREKFKDFTFDVRVNYGAGFKNEGEHYSKSYLIFALKAFLEKD